MAPLAAGFTIFVLCMLGINRTGASMNPARSFGSALVGHFWENHELYWIAPISGGITSTLLYELVLK